MNSVRTFVVSWDRFWYDEAGSRNLADGKGE